MSQHYDIARDLLAIKAVQIEKKNYFTWTSGNKITTFDVQPDVLACCATAGIPHAAWIADRLNLPMVYVRSSPKGHGKGNQIEGIVKKNQKVLVVEDLTSTGGSSIDTVNVLKS